MRRSAAIIVLVFSVLLVQISGLHLHICQGLEAKVDHPKAHYADRGVFFGDHHVDDDSDDEEVDLPSASAVPSPLKAPSFAFDFSWIVFHVPASVEIVPSIVVYVATRGPPPLVPAATPHFLPPSHGPPTYS